MLDDVIVPLSLFGVVGLAICIYALVDFLARRQRDARRRTGR